MMKKLVYVALGIVVVIGAVSFVFGKEDKSTLKKVLADNPTLLDVRSHGEWDAGHIEGSVHIPLNDLASNLNKIDGSKPVVVYCASGVRSERAKFILKKNGFEKTFNGGGWKNVQSILKEIK